MYEMKLAQAKEAFLMGTMNEKIKHIYACGDEDCETTIQRYADAVNCFASLYGENSEF